jgi:hypothetical protein
VFYLLAAIHLRKVFETMAQKTGESSFTTAGILLLLGAALTIIGIGLILILIAWIFATIGFFSMKPKDYQPYSNGYGYTQSPTQPQTSTQPINLHKNSGGGNGD